MLVVEDDALVRVAAVEFLADLGIAVEEAETGRQALGVLAAHGDIDLLITDVGLPDIDGHDLAAQARNLRPSLKIILASGYSEPGRDRKVDGEDLPTDVIRLTKPYEPADLRHAIESLGGSSVLSDRRTMAGLVPAIQVVARHTSATAGGWAQKRAWEMATLSVVASKGFVTTKAGSSISPVSSRSGKAVTKITGTSIDFRIS